MKTRSRVTVLVCGAVLAVACAAPGENTSALDNESYADLVARSGRVSGTDWRTPPTEGPSGMREVTSRSAASQYLSFTPRQPEGLEGSPRIFVQTSGGESERPQRGVVFVYDTDQYGLIHVTMVIDGLTDEQRHSHAVEAVARNGDPGVRGSAEIVIIRGGQEALIGYPADESRTIISWGEGKVLILITGPALTRAQAVEIAENL